MTGEEHYRKLERMYHSAPCNEYYSPRITISEGSAELIIPVQEKFFHSAGAMHGSVYFKALDDAAFFASNSLVNDFLVLTIQFSLHLMARVSEGEIRAHGKVIQNAGRFLIAESVLFDSAKREVARGSGTFVKSSIRLSPENGYK